MLHSLESKTRVRITRRIRRRSEIEASTNDLTGSARYVSRATEVDSIE